MRALVVAEVVTPAEAVHLAEVISGVGGIGKICFAGADNRESSFADPQEMPASFGEPPG